MKSPRRAQKNWSGPRPCETLPSFCMHANRSPLRSLEIEPSWSRPCISICGLNSECFAHLFHCRGDPIPDLPGVFAEVALQVVCASLCGCDGHPVRVMKDRRLKVPGVRYSFQRFPKQSMPVNSVIKV